MANDTRIYYNGIWLQNVLTDDVNQEVVMDSTGVNPIYVRVTVSVTCLVHMQAPSYSTNLHGIALPEYAPGDITLAGGYNVIIDNLMQPGRDFQMWVGDSMLFNVYPGWRRPGLAVPPQAFVPHMDVNHGPIPSVQIIQIVSATTFRIRFRVVCHLPYVDQDNQGAFNAISFRFWIGDNINCHDWTTERTYTGVLRVRHMGVGVHKVFRDNFKLPPLMGGFQRKRISMHERPNGIELEFSITDQEVWAAAPYPACDWEGSQSIYTAAAMGALFNSEVSVRVWGDKTVPKLGLLQLCQKIMDAKLHRLDMTKDKNTFLLSMRYRDDFKHNSVEAQATIRLIDNDGHVLWNVPKGSFCKDLSSASSVGFTDYDKEVTYAPGPTASIRGLFISLLQDPEHVTGWPLFDTSIDPITNQHYEDEPQQPTQPTLPVTQTLYSQGHKDVGSYNLYRMTSENCVNHGTIQLPIGKQSSGSNNTCRILQVHKSTGRRVVTIEAERIGTWPNIPPNEIFTDATTGIVHTPLATSLVPASPVLSWDGKKTLYHIDAKYTFAQDRSPNVRNSEIAAGLLPWRVPGNDSVYVVPATAFDDKSILNA